MKQLILIRHGPSLWNKSNLFTGWADAGLSARGLTEAVIAGQRLKAEGYDFDVCYTSVLIRAIKTLHLVLENMERPWLPVHKHWRLNERHYGALEGLNKTQTAEEYGDEQVQIWRRSYWTRPPALEPGDDRCPSNDLRYDDLDPGDLPTAESLQETSTRMLPYWHETIAPSIKSGNRVLIVAHGHSLRALIKHLDGVSDGEIPKLEIPTGEPLIYDLTDNLTPVRHYYLQQEHAGSRGAFCGAIATKA